MELCKKERKGVMDTGFKVTVLSDWEGSEVGWWWGY